MTWHKLGLVHRPDGRAPWSRTHAVLPVPVHRGGDLYRVYYATRDGDNRSHVGFFEIELRAPYPVVRVAEQPVLSPGPLGQHDDNGVYPSSLVVHQGRHYLYTVGWNRGPWGPLFYSSIGLAVSDDGEHFHRFSPAPVLARSPHDPCSVVSPMVLVEEGRWRMWYVSGIRWEATDGGMFSYYHVKYAESADGLNWQRDGHVAFDFAVPEERNIGRPYVLRESWGYRAWLPFNRGNGYRIGYAESPDGLQWRRQDERAGIGLSEEGWDSRMIAHPAVVRHNGSLYMFYNGNDYGKDGIGLAIAEEASPPEGQRGGPGSGPIPAG